MDFQKLDDMISFNYKAELVDLANSLGSPTVSGFVHNMYFVKFRSTREVCEALGVSQCGLSYWFKKWKWTARPKGGCHYKFAMNDPKVRQQIKDYKGKLNSREVAEKLNVCCQSTVCKIWREMK